ncbi:sodium/glucose cotransporter 4-like [Lingula anatina]|uniref:Sodium/glucose cotransporter 4-like n=1 Tax=Lingula anatina TaxID=7574 RepID=A0A1S3HSA2_LINAN|nr:sodium/glucose cotransporter 4-like [Lingula anatina]|eukprot:XP_013388915.1 sodium/glucose cotransporter 4-like [Lingula anatina]
MATVLHWGDILTIVVYFVIVLAVGLWTSIRSHKQDTVQGYFLAGKDMSWLPVGASIFATNVGSHFFIGMAGTAAASGIAVIMFEWTAIFPLLLLGWFFLPVYISSGCYTMPEYLRKRYGGERLRILLSVMSIFLMIVTKISVAVYSGAVFIQQALGWDLYIATISVVLITAVYTVLGGLSAVIYTDAVQTIILVGGALVMTGIGFDKVGGFEGLFAKFLDAAPNVTTCAGNVTAGYPPPDSLRIFRAPDSAILPWPGVVFGIMAPAVLVWCNEQIIVQRVLAAKNLHHAKGGTILAGYLKLLPFIIIVLPGMVSRVLFPDEVGCVDPDICEKVCQNRVGCYNIAYPKMVVEILPVGLRGLMLAVMLSALTTTLTSIFNSASSIFTLDLWTKLRKRATETEKMIVGRVFILVLVVVSIAWVPILNAVQGGQLWNYLQSIYANIAPPWCMVYVLGVSWTRTTEQGAFWGLLVGTAVGLTRMVMDWSFPKPGCGEVDLRPAVLADVHYLYFSIINSVISAVAIATISILTEPRKKSELAGVTWFTRHEKLQTSSVERTKATQKMEIQEPSDLMAGDMELGKPAVCDVDT